MNTRSMVMLALFVGNIFVAEENTMAQGKTVSEVAVTSKRAPGAPKYSDVCFSPRWRRPRDENDPHDTFRDATAFHATRFDWVYSSDPEWIADCRKRGYWFTGTLNSMVGGKDEKGRLHNKNGDRVTAPWMRKWNAYWGCVNSPAYREAYLALGKTMIDGGIDAIQMDDPGCNYTAVNWGACHCEHCKKKAAEEGVDLAKDMKAFQKKSIIAFYADMRKQLDEYAGRRIPWSSNNYNGNMAFPYDLFDYGTAELQDGSAKPQDLYNKITGAAKKGRQQIYTYVSTEVAKTRRVIAMAYGCGGHIIVPYDVWHGNRPRIFGTPEEYADLYGFARAVAPLLDGYEDAGVFSNGRIRDNRYGSMKPVETLGIGESVYGMTRAKPGQADAPAVVHLVDWREEPASFKVKLDSGLFFASGKIEVSLLVPQEYDAATHAKAAETKNFTALAKSISLPIEKQGNAAVVEVPRLTPWGILVVSAAKERSE